MHACLFNACINNVRLLGRRADTAQLGLESAGVLTNPHNGKVLCVNEQSSATNIFAVGDVVEGAPELTPVAIHAGKLLARRLYSESHEMMNYKVNFVVVSCTTKDARMTLIGCHLI